jgi:hypothetical protein
MSYPVHDLAKKFFGFGENPGVIKIILPSVSQKREVSLRCANYPLFEYEISPDDMFSAIRVYSLLTSNYGEIVELYSHNEIIIKPGYNQIFIGGPPTNSFIYHALKNAPIHYGESNVDRIIHGEKGSYEIGFSSPDPSSRWITEDTIQAKEKSEYRIDYFRASGLWAVGYI